MLRNKISQNCYNNDIICQIWDWKTSDTSVYDENEEKKIYKYEIRGYGITQTNNSIAIFIHGYMPSLYLKIKDTWTSTDVLNLKSKIMVYLSTRAQVALLHGECNFIRKKDFYGFNNDKLSNYIEIKVISKNVLYEIKQILSDESLFLNEYKFYDDNIIFYESKVDPLLRFLHETNINPCGWIRISKYEQNIPALTRCQLEINVNYKNIMLDNTLTISCALIASFDIECTSEDGEFPKPYRENDAIIQIGTTIYEYGTNKCVDKFIATLNACAPIKDVTVKSYKTEKQLLIGWAKYIALVDPDILTGYNIFKFDWEYIYERAKMNNCETEILKILSRHNKKPAKYEKNKKLASSALGDNILNYVDIEGLVHFDLIMVVRRELKLDSYKLDNVAHGLLGMNKLDLAPKEIFSNFRINTPKSIREIAIYCVKDCELVNEIVNKMQIITNNVGMANVCIVPISFLFIRGQGIKVFSLVSKYCNENGFIIKDLSMDDIDKNKYEGAHVHPPIPGIYYKPIAVMDYSSLYPSSMIAENISHDSIIGYKQYNYNNEYMYNIKITIIIQNILKKIKGLKPTTVKKTPAALLKENKTKIFKFNHNGKIEQVTISYNKSGIINCNEITNYFKPINSSNNNNDIASIMDNQMLTTNLNEINEAEVILYKDTIKYEYYNLPSYHYNEIKYTLYDEFIYYDAEKENKEIKEEILTGYKICVFAEKDIALNDPSHKSVIPQILLRLLTARNDTKKRMEYKEVELITGERYEGDIKETDTEVIISNVTFGKTVVSKDQVKNITKRYNEKTLEYSILDGLQLAYKLTGNSLYGQVGASTSAICYKELAASTTATGRNMLLIAQTKTLTKYPGSTLVYGDTDSVFVDFTDYIKNTYTSGIELSSMELLQESIKIGIEAAIHVSTGLKYPQKIVYEKTFYPFCIFSKKRYLGNKYGTNINKYTLTSMGNVLKRRDNAPIVKTIYQGVIDEILKGHSITNATNFFRDAIDTLLKGNVDISQLIISKTLKSDYSNPTSIAHKILADRMGERDAGNQPQSNDRIQYCYIDESNLHCNVDGCNMPLNNKECKCIYCMKLYCTMHLDNHDELCVKMCRYCKVVDDIKKCDKCLSFYCENCFIKHDSTKKKIGGKCKKPTAEKLLQGDIIETPQHIIDNNMKIDYKYYLDHQIIKPVDQIFELVGTTAEKVISGIVARAPKPSRQPNKQSSKKQTTLSFKSTALEEKAMSKATSLLLQKIDSELDGDDDDDIDILQSEEKQIYEDFDEII